MKIYKIWFIEYSGKIKIEEYSCVEKKQTYLVEDSWYVKKEELNKINEKWEHMYSLKNSEETLNLFRKLLKEKYDEELKWIQEKITRVQEKITTFENAKVEEHKFRD